MILKKLVILDIEPNTSVNISTINQTTNLIFIGHRALKKTFVMVQKCRKCQKVDIEPYNSQPTSCVTPWWEICNWNNYTLKLTNIILNLCLCSVRLTFPLSGIDRTDFFQSHLLEILKTEITGKETVITIQLIVKENFIQSHRDRSIPKYVTRYRPMLDVLHWLPAALVLGYSRSRRSAERGSRLPVNNGQGRPPP